MFLTKKVALGIQEILRTFLLSRYVPAPAASGECVKASCLTPSTEVCPPQLPWSYTSTNLVQAWFSKSTLSIGSVA